MASARRPATRTVSRNDVANFTLRGAASEMNLPNKLTISRFILTVAFMVVMFSQVPYHETIALVLFVGVTADAVSKAGKIGTALNRTGILD